MNGLINEILQAKDMVVFYKKQKVNGKVKYVFDTICLVDSDGKIISKDHKGEFISKYTELDDKLLSLESLRKGQKKTISSLRNKRILPEKVYYIINLNTCNRIIIENLVQELKTMMARGELDTIDDKAIKHFVWVVLMEPITSLEIKEGTYSKYEAVYENYKPINVEKLQELFQGIEYPDKLKIIISNAIEILKEVKTPKKQAGQNQQIVRPTPSLPPKEILEFNKDEYAKMYQHPNSKPTEKKETKYQVGTKINKEQLVAIIEETCKQFIGQEIAVKNLAYNIFLNTQLLVDNDNEFVIRNKSKILLDGPTGTGKTAILRSLAKKMSVPIVITGTNDYSTVGYVGANLTDILVDLLNKCNGNIEQAEQGVVCFDEFDKLAVSKDNKDSIFKKGIQNELLKFIEGNTYDINYNGEIVKFDTSKLTVIFMGAFTDLREGKMTNETDKQKIGFNSQEVSEKEKTYTLGKEDYIQFGLQRELIGRINTFVSTKQYTIEDLINILTKSTVSPLKEFIEFAKKEGITIEYDNKFIEEYAKMAYEKNTGARALEEIKSELRNMLLEDIIFRKTDTIKLTTEHLNKLKEKEIRRY